MMAYINKMTELSCSHYNLNHSYETVNQACSAIRQVHLAANMDDPTAFHLMKIFKSGVANTLTAQKKATPVDIEPICKLFLSWRENDRMPADYLQKKVFLLACLD